MPTEILSGIRVLDFGQYIAGPMAGMMLAEQGAEVIKVERPQHDPMRGEDGFMVWNRSKKNIVLDLKKQEGKKIALDMACKADIIIENFRPGVMEKLGIGYAAVKAINPRIIYCSITGFGDRGPYSTIPGYEPLVSSLGTLYDEQGFAAHPMYVVLPLASTYAALEASYSIVAALCVREKTGKGQKVDIAMFDSLLSTCRQFTVDFKDRIAGAWWSPYGPIPLYRPYKCADGKYIFLGTGNFKFVTMFAIAIGREDWLADDFLDGAPFLIMPPRSTQLAAYLAKLFKTKKRDEWLDELLSAGIPVAPVQTIEDYMDYVQLKENNMLKRVRQPGKGMVTQMNIPVKMLLTPGSVKGPAASAGEHTVEVLRRLGHRADDIRRLKREKVVK